MAQFNVKASAYGKEVIIAVEAETSIEAIEKVKAGEYWEQTSSLTEGHEIDLGTEDEPKGHELEVSIVE